VKPFRDIHQVDHAIVDMMAQLQASPPTISFFKPILAEDCPTACSSILGDLK
jgi:hypothetical protein